MLTGPTAAGKTELALALADRFAVELISVDSAQVYRGLDIGSAKPAPDVLARYPHALIDIRDPEQTYSAADFAADAERLMTEIRGRGRVPVLVGGTVLYLKALRYGLDSLPPADPEIRRRLDEAAAEHGWPAMHARLAEVDPAAARRIRSNDPQRIQRALEIHACTGKPASDLMSGRGPDRMGHCLALVLTPGNRHLLHERIDRRVARMVEGGLLDELAGLMQRPGLGPDRSALRAVGYRQAWQHLAGESTRAEFLERTRSATRRLAKRQLTGLRQYAGALWYDPLRRDTIDRVFRRVETFLARLDSE